MAKRVKVRSYKRKTKSGYTIVKGFIRKGIENVLTELAFHSPKIKKQKEEVLRRRKAASEKKEATIKDRYQIKDSSNRVLSVSSTNKGHTLKPGQYIVDTHNVQNNNGRKWKAV